MFKLLGQARGRIRLKRYSVGPNKLIVSSPSVVTDVSAQYIVFVNLSDGLLQGPVKVPALPYGRATEQVKAQVSSPRVSKGWLNTIELWDFDGALRTTQARLPGVRARCTGLNELTKNNPTSKT
jgi:hypothetical protein